MPDSIREGEFSRFVMMIDGRLNDLSVQISEGFKRINGRLDKVEARVTDVEGKGCHLLPMHKDIIETLSDRAPMSKPKQAGVIAGISSIVVGLIELARTVASHFLK